VGLHRVAAWLLVRGTTLRFKGRRLHWSGVLVSLLLAGIAVLGAVDRFTANGAPARAPAPRVLVDTAIAQWVDAMRAEPELCIPCQRVFFVASEGGGIRAAYWTSRTLLALREQLPRFDLCGFMLSGV